MHILDPNTGCTFPSFHIESILERQLHLARPQTIFGMAFGGAIHIDHQVVPAGHFFCYRIDRDHIETRLTVLDRAVLIRAMAYQGHAFMTGLFDTVGPGHVQYVDGCTDSLLICPPRLGQPCLNALYFPPNTDQSWHTHPSFRAGLIVSGAGRACFRDGIGSEVEVDLRPGDVWSIAAHESHRFRTIDSPMTVLAFHPDSDWGPTDEVHPMINKTLISEPPTLK